MMIELDPDSAHLLYMATLNGMVDEHHSHKLSNADEVLVCTEPRCVKARAAYQLAERIARGIALGRPWQEITW